MPAVSKTYNTDPQQSVRILRGGESLDLSNMLRHRGGHDLVFIRGDQHVVFDADTDTARMLWSPLSTREKGTIAGAKAFSITIGARPYWGRWAGAA